MRGGESEELMTLVNIDRERLVMGMPAHKLAATCLELADKLDEEQKRSDGYGAACAESEAQLAERTRELGLARAHITRLELGIEPDESLARQLTERTRERDDARRDRDSGRQRWYELERIQDRQLTFDQVALELAESNVQRDEARATHDTLLKERRG